MKPRDRAELLKKLRLAGELFKFAMRVKSHRLKRQHPDWSPEQIRTESLRLIEAGCR